MPKTKVEVYDKDQLIYPYIESDHVTFSNGMKVNEMLDQSISMPTVIHEDLSFKVGVGDQDVSSAIVDSSVSEMTIKGKTYQNILPEPSTHVLTNNKEMFKVNEGLDPNVEIVDGVAKSAILTGQTLVNILTEPITNRTFTTGKANTQNTTQLQANKKYIAFIDIASVTNEATGIYMRIHNTRPNGNGVVLPIKDEKFTVGLHKLIFTMPSSSYNEFEIMIGFVRNAEATVTYNYAMVIEYQDGMENWDIPYFEGMQSVKMPVLKTTGKNLWSGENITIGKYVDGQGALTAANTDFLSDFIKVKPNTTYAFKVMDSRATTPYGVKSLYDKNKKFIGRGNGVHSDNVPFTTPSNCHYVRIHGNSYTQCGNTIPDCMLIETTSNPSTITTHEPYKSNILSTPKEVVLRSLPNGVKDTLNLNTGEYVKRIGEVVLNGSETWNNAPSYINGSPRFCYDCSDIKVRNNVGNQLVLTNSDTIISVPSDIPKSATKGVFHHNVSAQIHIFMPSSEIGGTTPSNFKTYLQQNPVTVQYELATPIIKTVDLSSSGNWEKIVFNGSENWSVYPRNSSVNFVNTIAFQTNTIPNAISTENYQLFSESFRTTSHYASDVEGIFMKGTMRLSIKKSKLMSQDVDGLKQYLQQNPLTVWYQTVVHQDSTQVKQPIFFKDGHIQLSSGADNSLIPTLNYQAKTSNSYVMDLMKTNTKYTMKAKTASGTFTIDGTSYGAGTNGTFTTPSSMTNKFLVMSNKTNEEVMILEGDVVSKTIPYFKGIKSTFEGEDKIEVLSTGKNLFDLTLTQGRSTYEKVGEKPSVANSDTRVTNQLNNYIEITPNTKITFSILNNIDYAIGQLDGNGNSLGDTGWVGYQSAMPNYTLTTKPNAKYIGFNFRKTDNSAIKVEEVLNSNPMLEIGSSPTTYESHKSNNTKIPLLSPLRSLPNGVCDELIIDRESNKAKIIQRVGELDFSNLQYNTWIVSDSTLSKTVRFTWLSSNMSFYKVKDSSDGICDSIPYIRHNSSDTEHCRFDGSNPSAFMIWVDKSKLTSFDDKGLKKYLSTLPSTRVQYELATPVITEVDLEGFPYIYKDGHIFLNSKIVSTTEIVYSVNQCQQISASNEDIIRHEKELTYLQKLIAQYVQVDYESALLSLKV